MPNPEKKDKNKKDIKQTGKKIELPKNEEEFRAALEKARREALRGYPKLSRE